MLFSERNKLAEEYKVWLEENPQVEDCPFNVVTFLDSRMLLINSKEKEEISSKTEMKWSWNETNSDTWNHGTFKTKEEAIKDAIGCKDWIKRELGTDNPIIFIGQCEDIPLRTDPDPDRIMEELDQAYCNDSGCDTYIYDGVTDEERKWLEDKLSELMFEFHQKIGLNPGWFKVVTMEEINLNDYKERYPRFYGGNDDKYMIMDARQKECYEKNMKLTAPCSLCNNGQVKINYISTMNITSQWYTYDLGRLDEVNFCPRCGKILLK